jgi:hypothetical protein
VDSPFFITIFHKFIYRLKPIVFAPFHTNNNMKKNNLHSNRKTMASLYQGKMAAYDAMYQTSLITTKSMLSTMPLSKKIIAKPYWK